MPTKQQYLKRRLSGLCSLCSNKAENNKSLCLLCKEKHNRYYLDKKQKGVCLNCESQAEPKKTRCKICAEKQKIITKNRTKRRKTEKKCIICNSIAEKNKLHCNKCLFSAKEKRDSYRRLGLCTVCGAQSLDKKRCEKCRLVEKRAYDKLRSDVINAYGGPICKCCGESHIELLSIDHINNDGQEHRKRVHASGIYRDLRKNNFPPGYQVLCHNCNFGRYAYGECPHKKEKINVAPEFSGQTTDSSSRLVSE